MHDGAPAHIARDLKQFLLKAAATSIRHMPGLFSVPGILRVTGLSYEFKLMESVFSNLRKHFVNIKTLLC
jgi:hypothetical protein